MGPAISVVVPVYNEADFLSSALPALIAALEDVVSSYQIHLVENGSTDGTADTARRLAGNSPVTVESLPEPNYGAAMRQGFLAATGDWVINFDIDYFSAEFVRTVLAQPESVDIVIGSKRDPDSDDQRPALRRLATKVFNLLLTVILNSKVSDTHGMKGFRKNLVAELAPPVLSTQDLCDTELVIRAERAGYRIVEVPVTVEEIRQAKSSLIKRAPRTVAGMFKIRRALRSAPR